MNYFFFWNSQVVGEARIGVDDDDPEPFSHEETVVAVRRHALGCLSMQKVINQWLKKATVVKTL
jgi:hypothetical protein